MVLLLSLHSICGRDVTCRGAPLYARQRRRMDFTSCSDVAAGANPPARCGFWVEGLGLRA